METCNIDKARSYRYNVFHVLYCSCGFFVFDTEETSCMSKMSKHLNDRSKIRS